MLQEKEMTVYLDNSATTRQYDEVTDIMIRYMREQFGNPSSLYRPGIDAEKAVKEARRSLSRAFACGDDEIYFTSGGTESDNTAIFGAAEAGKRRGKRIITTAVEHPAVSEAVKRLEESGFEAVYVPVNKDGILDVSALKDAVNEETVLISVMTVNNENGVIMPISEIAVFKDAYNREHGTKILLHTDAVQAAGHIPVNVKKQNIDMLSLSAHKFHGPRGIGALYVKRGIELTSLMEGGGQERGKRPGTENLPAIMGMAAALKEECTLMEQNEAKVTAMRDRLIQGLSQIPYSILNGSREKRLPGNVNFCFEGVSGESLLLLLDSRGICASSGSACASGALDPSHVLLSLGLAPEIAQGSLRISLDISNTEEEIDYMLEVIPQVVEQLRGMSDDWRKKHCED